MPGFRVHFEDLLDGVLKHSFGDRLAHLGSGYFSDRFQEVAKRIDLRSSLTCRGFSADSDEDAELDDVQIDLSDFSHRPVVFFADGVSGPLAIERSDLLDSG